MKPESKPLYLLLAILSLALLSIPSLLLWDAVKSHFSFVDSLSANISAGSPKPAHLSPSTKARVIFVPFSVKAPKALKAGIAADFNSWDAARLPLLKGKDGTWSTEIPLPAGRYCYQIVLDGNAAPDSHLGLEQATVAGKKCTVLVVK
ncbi:MAG TPA: hypothetical protein PLL10_00400 [Elusimicrobiales bacterium]|nr:hypothetical protein [Elusimicrobiales bacterium]